MHVRFLFFKAPSVKCQSALAPLTEVDKERKCTRLKT